eukprot:jgi/Hompol1/280/HPOL_003618-RA
MIRTLVAVAAAAAAVAAAVLDPQTLVSMNRLSEPVVSPDGAVAVFISSQSLPASPSTSKLLLVHLPVAGTVTTELPQLYPLGTNVGTDPFWLSPSLLAVRCPDPSNSKLQQICVADLSNVHNSSVIEFKQLTHLPSGITAARFNPSVGLLVFASPVVVAPRPKPAGASGVVFDSLFVRHWDAVIDPTKRSHLFKAHVNISSNNHVSFISESVTDLFEQAEFLDSPVGPFGDASNFAISPDGSTVAFASRLPDKKAAWSNNIDIFVVPTDGSAAPKPVSTGNLGADTNPVFSPSGNVLAWLQMRTPQYEADLNRIVLHDFASGKTKSLTKGWDRSAESIVFMSENVVVTTAQDLGRVKVFSINVSSGKVIERVGTSSTHGISAVPGSKALLGLVHHHNSPNDIVLISTSTWGVSRLTEVNKEILSRVELSDPEASVEFWFKGAHKDDVHGWLFKPVNFDRKKRYPLAFLIHGGPESAWNDDWSYRWNPQVFAAQGFFGIIVAINFHGSTGFGSKFTRAILGNWGGAPYEDLMKGLKAVLKANPEIDRNRVAGLGASYGGYMINWINGHSRNFACLVNHDGMFDTTAAYFSTDELWFPESEFKATPFDRKAAKLYEKWSPSNYAHKWETPTLVIHGELDYRLSITEGLSTFTALQRRGVPSKLLYFPNENHWVLNSANSLQWHAEIFEWIKQWTAEGIHTVESDADDLDGGYEQDEFDERIHDVISVQL